LLIILIFLLFVIVVVLLLSLSLSTVKPETSPQKTQNQWINLWRPSQLLLVIVASRNSCISLYLLFSFSSLNML
jgi:hypothetical protein